MPNPKVRKRPVSKENISSLIQRGLQFFGKPIEQYDHELTIRFIDATEGLIDIIDELNTNIAKQERRTKTNNSNMMSLKKSIDNLAVKMEEFLYEEE